MADSDSVTWSRLVGRVREATGIALDPDSRASQGGGCINAAWLVDGRENGGGTCPYFVKANRADKLAMFEVESAALAEIAATGTIRVPRPFWHGAVSETAFLVLEGITLRTQAGREAEYERGRQLAEMHRCLEPEGRYGWHRENVIGETPQPNDWQDSWVGFYARNRLGFQFRLAEKRGRNFRGAVELIERLPDFFGDYRPASSLLHGDLWGGNAAFDEEGNPVLFDPATYYGDRETDLAFTELFGGFGAEFYRGYESAWPLDSGFGVRKRLYNLYHVLNHDHLFGGGYGTQAQGMIDALLQGA